MLFLRISLLTNESNIIYECRFENGAQNRTITVSRPVLIRYATSIDKLY